MYSKTKKIKKRKENTNLFRLVGNGMSQSHFKEKFSSKWFPPTNGDHIQHQNSNKAKDFLNKTCIGKEDIYVSYV